MRSFRRPGHIAWRLILALLVAGTAALAVPVSAHADEDELSLRVTGPITFGSAPGCAVVVNFGLSSEEGKGSGAVCVISFGPPSFPCDPSFVCDDAQAEATLNLPEGTIQASWTQFETFTPDFSRVFIRIAGTVTGGTGEFAELVGADISGRGRVNFAPDGTGAPKRFALEIGEDEDEDEDEED